MLRTHDSTRSELPQRGKTVREDFRVIRGLDKAGIPHSAICSRFVLLLLQTARFTVYCKCVVLLGIDDPSPQFYGVCLGKIADAWCLLVVWYGRKSRLVSGQRGTVAQK